MKHERSVPLIPKPIVGSFSETAKSSSQPKIQFNIILAPKSFLSPIFVTFLINLW